MREREREEYSSIYVMGKEEEGSEISLRGMTKEKPKAALIGEIGEHNLGSYSKHFHK